MTSLKNILGLGLVFTLAGTAQAQITEDFESGNADNWRMDFDGTYNGFAVPAIPATHVPSGGNPGGYIQFQQIQSQTDTWFLNGELATSWKGDLRAAGVQGVDMDMRYVGNSPWGMHMYVVLGDDMGTPELTDDILIWSPYDPGAYSFAGFGVALPENTWNSVHWDMDLSSTTLPANWTVWSYTGTNSGDDNADWNAVVQDVDYVAFINGAPWGGFTLGFVDIDFDNLSLDTGAVGTSRCFCDGSGTAAPCGNAGAAGNGCANGANGAGSNLSAVGINSAAASTVVLNATGAPAGNPGLFFQGDTTINSGNGQIFNDGLRCAGVNIIRLQVRTTDANGDATSTIDIANRGGVNAGETKSYQFWYRDPQGSPCGGNSNLSNALEITWLP